MDTRNGWQSSAEATFSGQDLYLDLQQKLELWKQSLEGFRTKGLDMANAEHDYRLLAAQWVIAYREAGYPVTIIDALVKGQPDVAEKRLARDIAEVEYKYMYELEMGLKKQLALTDNQLSREWGASGY